MAYIPQVVLSRQPVLQGLNLRGRGKVRDSYDLPDHPNLMMPVASNRCSIFDFVLNTEIPQKGEILTALSCFWDREIISKICTTDLVAFGSQIDEYLPDTHRDNPATQKTATIVSLYPEPEVEDIVRLYLTGSSVPYYKKDRIVCGHKLPEGLIDGSKLPYPIYTPSTKAKVGHDEHITADSVAKRFGNVRERLALQVASALSSYAESRGVIVADTKLEWSDVLVDEKGTPDSSRFWDAIAWKKAHAQGKLPPSFDKQFVREWGKTAFIEKDENGRKREPENPEDLEFVSNQVVPEEVVKRTIRLYRYIFWRLTGMKIEAYQRDEMEIEVEIPKPKIEVLLGSESDLDQAKIGLDFLRYSPLDLKQSILSCHRNPAELREFVKNHLVNADVVIAGAGMAAALPGIVKSELSMLGRPDIPVIGVAFQGKTERSNQAAILSIEDLPGQMVELDPNGKAYSGHSGFLAACKAAMEHEFLPRGIEAKPAKIHF